MSLNHKQQFTKLSEIYIDYCQTQADIIRKQLAELTKGDA